MRRRGRVYLTIACRSTIISLKGGEEMAAERQTLSHGFGPYYDQDSRILILGSFPSVKSREAAFFYGHPRNRFWAVLAALFGEDAPGDLTEKKAFLSRHRIALYDVIESCSIVGSSDTSIRNVVPADMKPILSGSKIEGRIFTNGRKASELYARYIEKDLGLASVPLPSTSPANAACSLQTLIESWSHAIVPVLAEDSAESEKNGSKKA